MRDVACRRVQAARDPVKGHGILCRLPRLVVKIVGLVPSRFVRVLFEAQIVVGFVCVLLESIGDSTANRIWVAQFFESLVVRRLEVVVDLATLFLLS